MNIPASQLVDGDAQAFAAFLSAVRRDVDAVLRDYDIADHATLRQLLAAKLDLQQLAGEYTAALETVKAIRSLEDKPASKLMNSLLTQAELTAATAAQGTSGTAYEQAFTKSYSELVLGLPWDIVQDPAKGAWAQSKLASPASVIAGVKSELDPAVSASHALDAGEAWALVTARKALQFDVPLKGLRATMLRQYITAHHVIKPDIWAAREVTLTAADHLTPVLIGIWDTGVDVFLFGTQLFTDPSPTLSGTHELAFADDGSPSQSWLWDLTPAQHAEYPTFRDELKGRLDLENGVESPEAERLLDHMSTSTAEQLHDRRELQKWLSFYVHSTHVAGIATRGNPAARLVVARFNDQLPDLPFRPTLEWARRLQADFQMMSDYFRTRHVRVVNMSWSDDPQEFELWLSKTGGPTDPAARKKAAADLYAVWHDAVERAITGAPDTLFVCAAGNSDSDASFLQDVPAGLRLANVLTVGAVNQAGDETSFTSYGPTVRVDADGYEVESYVPGGARLRLSGTSMAAPNVANLAAKLFALDPTLSPQAVVDLITRGATPSEDGRRHLIDPKRSVELLKTKT
jgi:subtilisin family serine protease